MPWQTPMNEQKNITSYQLKLSVCGIICEFGNGNVIPSLIEGIRKLEYRGYDSFGCAIHEDNRFIIYKDVGRIDEILDSFSIRDKISDRGLFHTRWATNGGVEVENSHPHTDCTNKIALVHNGIIENWAYLKKGLSSHEFKSKTDTEVLAHLLEEYLRKYGDLKETVKEVASRLVGLSSFVVAHPDFDYMVAFKNGSPLVMGIGDNGIFVSSDVPSLLGFTNRFVFLHDGDMVIFSRAEYEIVNIFGERHEHGVQIVNLNPISMEKGHHRHFMEKEIFDQLQVWKKQESAPPTEYLKAADLISKSDKVFVIGSGSSYHAALHASRLFLKNGILAYPVNGEEIRDYGKIIDNKSVFLLISQSGETADLISTFPLFKNISKIGVVNVPSSTIAREVNVLLKMRTGVERAVPSTKSLTSSLSILTRLASFVSGEEEEAMRDFSRANKEIYNFIVPSVLSAIDRVAGVLKELTEILVLGRGESLIYSMEGALKLKECTYIHAEAIDMSGLKHGPIALVDDSTWVLAILTRETMSESLMNLQEVKSRGAKIIAISPENHELFDLFIGIPDLHDFSFMPIMLVLQLLSYKIAILKGIDPDMPRNLAKSVTVR